jgi:hypothetical protein
VEKEAKVQNKLKKINVDLTLKNKTLRKKLHVESP